MVLSQGFTIGDDRELLPPVKENGETDYDKLNMSVPSGLVPYCPVCGEPMSMNLRADGTFVEDEGWHEACENYEEFLDSYKGQHILFLELGVGGNTPVIIKFGFHELTKRTPQAVYACINYGEAYCPKEIEDRSIVINADCGKVIDALLGQA